MKSGVYLLLVMFVALVLAGCSQQGGMSGGAIPPYSGSKEYSPPAIYSQLIGIPTEGVSVKIYYVENAGVKDVLQWYKEKLSDYEVAEELSLATITTPQGSVEWGGVLFKKGDNAVGIWAISGTEGKGTIYYVVQGPVDKILGSEGGSDYTQAEQLPSSDQTSGKEPVARYPGSVMLYYASTTETTGEEIGISYGTSDSATSVAEWYRNELVANGWTLETESSDNYGIYMEFSKDSEYLSIDISKPSETQSFTKIVLDYQKLVLPSQDVVQGEEPMKRYPNAVMLEHNTFTSGGAKAFYIKYGTYDDPKDVFDWYKNELNIGGWQIVSSSSEGGTWSIFGVKENVGVEITISKDGYTVIDFTYSTYS